MYLLNTVQLHLLNFTLTKRSGLVYVSMLKSFYVLVVQLLLLPGPIESLLGPWVPPKGVLEFSL